MTKNHVKRGSGTPVIQKTGVQTLSDRQVTLAQFYRRRCQRKSMEYVWNKYGIRSELAWNVHGIRMEFGLEFVWKPYGISME